MRILHTSDWHIGRTFHGYATLDALREVLGVLVEQVREHDVDVVVVSGDVFDSATPAGPAYTLLGDILVALEGAGARVIVTSGNHDSAARLGFQARLLREGIHVCTDPLRLSEPITVRDADGPVYFFGIPYLEPALVRQHWADASDDGALRTQAAVMTQAMGLVRESLARNPGRSVVLAHCFAAGVEPTAGLEREVRVGGLDEVPLSVFEGIDYVALGHIHGRSQLSERVRYCGAPLHYNFGEGHKPRGSWLVDLAGTGEVSAEWLELPVPRRLVTLEGALDELLADDLVAAHEDAWINAVYTDPVPQRDPMQRLKERYPFCAMVQHRPEGGVADDGRRYAERMRAAVTDEERVEAFLSHVRAGEGPSEGERALIRDVLDERLRSEAVA